MRTLNLAVALWRAVRLFCGIVGRDFHGARIGPRTAWRVAWGVHGDLRWYRAVGRARGRGMIDAPEMNTCDACGCICYADGGDVIPGGHYRPELESEAKP